MKLSLNEKEVLECLQSARKYLGLIPLDYPKQFNEYVNEAESNIISAIKYIGGINWKDLC